ncbi:MAG: MBG domain-containing protein [Candidatus Methylacidiphilales bacterium]|nr:MBG domain-containing protein [Candidatus Methylacidiphilales bacterium]
MKLGRVFLMLSWLCALADIQAASVYRGSQYLLVSPVSPKTYGDAPFSLNVQASSGLPVVLTLVSGPAALSGNQTVTLTGAGVVRIRASQAGNADLKPVVRDVQFAVKPALLTATADNQWIYVGAALPAFTVSYSGFVNGDGPSVLTTVPRATCKAKNTSAAGNFPIQLSQTKAANYLCKSVSGTLSIRSSSSGSGSFSGGSLSLGSGSLSGATLLINPGSGVGSIIKQGNSTLNLSGNLTVNSGSLVVGGTTSLTSTFTTHFVYGAGVSGILTIASQSVPAGRDAVFLVPTVGLSSLPVTYQWQISTDQGGTWTDLLENATYTGVQTATLTVRGVDPLMNGHRFKCRLTGTQLITSSAFLTVQSP